jgi:membrane-associated phospholipid phosphatase
VYTKMHHASDVVVGAALGATIATIANRAWPKP